MADRQSRESRLDGYPIPGLVRRARRIAGLSQADLAEVAGVSQSTIHRVETGALTPSLAVFQRIMAAAGLHVVVVDDEGRVIEPMEEWVVPMDVRGGVRNGAGRRYPAHLDVVLDPAEGEWWGDIFGFARPPETFYRDPPDLREYRRRFSEWQVRRERFEGRPPPVPPAWWIAAQRDARERAAGRSPSEDLYLRDPHSEDRQVDEPDVGEPDVGEPDVSQWDGDESGTAGG